SSSSRSASTWLRGTGNDRSRCRPSAPRRSPGAGLSFPEMPGRGAPSGVECTAGPSLARSVATERMDSPPSLSRWGALEELSSALSQGAVCLEAPGLWGSARPLTVAALARRLGRPALVVAPGPTLAHAIALDIAFFLSTWPPSTPALAVVELPPAA